MFKWLHREEASELVEKARLRQQARNAAIRRRDPMEEMEVLDPQAVEVEEISPEEFADLMHRTRTGQRPI